MAKTTGLASISEGRSDIHRVAPSKLKVRPNWNSRDPNAPENIEHIDMLAQSIAQIGVKEPLTVSWEDGEAWIVDGHCRHAASLRAISHYKCELKTIPVKTEERYASEADRVLSQLVRNSGKPLTLIEQGVVYKRLLALGWQQQEIAAKVGLSSSRISQILGLQVLPEGVKAMVVNGTVSAGMAVQQVQESGGTAAEKELKQALTAAKAEGKNKVLPRHVAEVTGNDARVSIGKLVKEAIEFSDVDNEAEDFVIIKMPVDHWEKIREALKL